MISTKVLAWTVGAVGIGLVGNLINAVNILSMLGTGGIGQGVTKYVAENFDRPQRQRQFITHGLRLTLISTLLVSLAIIIFHRPLAYYIFKSHEYNSIVILLGATIVLYAVNMLFVYILNGFKQYRKYVQVNVISSLISLLVSVWLVLQFKIYGALSATIAAQSVIIVVTLHFVKRDEWFRQLFKRSDVDWNIVKLLARFSIMTIVSTFVVQFAQFNVRTYVGQEVSPDAAGIWESVNRISSMYLMIITTSISTYYLPRLAEIRENEILRREILKTMKLVLPPLMVACGLIYLFRDLIIWILFTKEFGAARDLFAMQMVGDFFKIASWLIAFLFWAKAMTRQFIFTEIIFSAGYIVLARIFVDNFGIRGAVNAYATNYFIYFLIILFVFRRLLFNRSRVSDAGTGI